MNWLKVLSIFIANICLALWLRKSIHNERKKFKEKLERQDIEFKDELRAIKEKNKENKHE